MLVTSIVPLESGFHNACSGEILHRIAAEIKRKKTLDDGGKSGLLRR
jgi:hypothetical protein